MERQFKPDQGLDPHSELFSPRSHEYDGAPASRIDYPEDSRKRELPLLSDRQFQELIEERDYNALIPHHCETMRIQGNVEAPVGPCQDPVFYNTVNQGAWLNHKEAGFCSSAGDEGSVWHPYVGELVGLSRCFAALETMDQKAQSRRTEADTYNSSGGSIRPPGYEMQSKPRDYAAKMEEWMDMGDDEYVHLSDRNTYML